MDKLPIQGKVAFVEIHPIQTPGLVAVGRKIEYGQIEKIDGRCMGKGEFQGPLGAALVLRRCAEEQIHVSGDAR